MRGWRMAFLAALAAIPLFGAAPAFDSRPWLEDWAQVEDAMASKYANLEWAVFDHEVDLKRLSDETRARIVAAGNETEARAAFDRYARHLGDGHVVFDWPRVGGPVAATAGAPAGRCAELGYNPAINGPAVAAHAAGFRPLPEDGAPEFPTGMLDVGATRVGVIKIGLFSPGATPALCEAALKALAIPADQPCTDECRDRVDAWASARMTGDLARRLRGLKSAGAQVLLVDVAGNGGGSEWAEAAARMLSARRLVSERGGFVRGAHWVQTFADDEATLRQAAKAETGAERTVLLALADKVAAMRIQASTPCDPSAFFAGRRPACAWLGQGYSGTGPLASADPARLRGKPWAATVFSPMEFPYEEGVWRGPVIVLIDQDAGSATAEFAADLQDNHAAVIMGAPATGGCGHTNGGTPTVLAHSKAVFEVPDCARFRADGSNEVRGIQPDVLVGFTSVDGPRLQGSRLTNSLPQAVAMATRLAAMR